MTKIGVQLWTVRDQLTDVRPLFDQLAAVGIEAVEPFGLGDANKTAEARIGRARELRRAAESAGLAILSTHTSLPSSTDTTVFVDEMHELGASYALLAVPEGLAGFKRETFLSVDAIHEYAHELDALAEAVESEGLQIGYHNHSWEWNELQDGTLAYDLLWSRVGPRIVAELDVLWAAFAGQDVVEIAQRLKDRIRFLHVGDASPITNVDFQLPAGAGESPLAPVFEVTGPVEAVFIEATTPPPGSTQLDLIRQSVEWLRPSLAKIAR